MKIFGIGLARTGTTTLAKSLEILGYKSVHVECNIMEVTDNNGIDEFNINKDVIESNDAIVGTPLCPCYQLLAEKYPDALFIITVRESESWLISCSLGFTDRMVMDENHCALHRWLYDSRLYDRDKFLKGYTNYLIKVLNYFDGKNRDRLLLYNICSGSGWYPLCNFLKKEIPYCALPHESKRKILGP